MVGCLYLWEGPNRSLPRQLPKHPGKKSCTVLLHMHYGQWRVTTMVGSRAIRFNNVTSQPFSRYIHVKRWTELRNSVVEWSVTFKQEIGYVATSFNLIKDLRSQIWNTVLCSTIMRNIVTDHRPFVRLFWDWVLKDIENPRFLWLKEKTLQYRFHAKHLKGSSI